MKRRFMVLVISAILLLNSLFSTSFAGECEHQWTLEYDPMYNYEYKDETYHILSSIKLYYICKLCSETKIEYQDGSNEKSKHVFTNDVCYSCGYEREEEEHEHRWKLRYDPEYNYEYLNDEYHVLTDIELYYKCKDCGETKKEYQDGGNEKSKHEFTGDTCYTCGYVKEEEPEEKREEVPEEPKHSESSDDSTSDEEDIHEHVWKMEYDPWYKYAKYDENYHVLDKIVLSYKCNCGETKTEEQSGNGYKDNHVFTDNICYTCGYVREEELEEKQEEIPEEPKDSESSDDSTSDEEDVHEHVWEMEYDPWYKYAKYDENYHVLDKIVLSYKCNCGETKTEEQSGNGYKDSHAFIGNTCNTCGYVKEELEEKQEEVPEEPKQDESSDGSTDVEEDTHEHVWKMEYDPWYKYAKYDENYHVLDKIILSYKCECGETKTEEQSGNGELEEHKFNDNTCYICEFSKSTISEDNSEVVSKDDDNVADKPEISSDKVKDDTLGQETNQHVCSFKEPYQVWIGAYTNITDKTHTEQHVTFAYCVDCGEKRIFSNETQEVVHTLEKGTCKWCKYKIYSSDDDINYAVTQINELKSLLNTLESLKNRNDFSISEETFNSIKNKINNFIYEYEAVLRNENFVNAIRSWQDDNDLKLIMSLRDKDYPKKVTLPKIGNVNVSDYVDYVYINLEKPDNKWYYFVGDAGEQIILGNFSEKVTITGTIGAIIVGELPIVGTAADIRDVTADFANWEWSWGHAGITALDIIGMIPLVGALKYSDELCVAAKGMKLSDNAGDILSSALKHADDASGIASKSDELAEVVQKAVLKHADEVGGVTKVVSKNLDDVAKAVKHPEIFSENTLQHIFLGNKTGGFHYEGLSDATSKVVQITKAPDANGVYQAMVEIGGKAKKTPSTFFPKSWSPEKIVESIEDVYFNPTGVDTIRKMYDGVVDGVNIRLFLDEYGKIISAFPVM